MSTAIQAIEPTQVCRKGQKTESIFMRIGLVRSAAEGINRRGFESRLAKLVNSALAHEQEGTEPGADAYKRLYRMADEMLTEYCLDRGCDRQDLEAQIPAVAKLRNLAQPAAATVPVYLRPSSLIAFAGLSAVVAMVIGVDHGLYAIAHHVVAGLIH